MNPSRLEDPRLDDLQYKGLRLYQREDLPCFTQDSVLLADYADLCASDIAVDIGAGTGVLSILCHARTGAQFCCIEKEAALCELLQRSLALNGLDFPIYNMDWSDAPALLGHSRFTAALCNPPYFQKSKPSPNAARASARSGKEALREAITCAAKLLQNKGKLFLCYPAAELTEVFFALREAGLEPKRLRLVAHNAAKAPYLALLLARKGGNPGLCMQPLLFLKDEAGQDSKELRNIYHMLTE